MSGAIGPMSGPAGPAGATGSTGATGSAGATGSTGATGSAGASGVGSVTQIDVTLTGGTGTQASGLDLSSAKIVGVWLKTVDTSSGEPKAAISANNVVVTSYAAGTQVATDASTYTVALVGAV